MVVLEGVLGADPGSDMEWEEEKPRPRQFMAGELYGAIRHYMDKAPFDVVFNDTDKIILAKEFKREAARGMTLPDIRRSINRFFLMDAAVKSNYSPKMFASRSIQVQLNATFPLTPARDTTGDPTTDTIMRFIAQGMVRYTSDPLPWDEDFDTTLRTVVVTDPSLLGVVMTYPDVVATLLRECPGPDVYPHLDAVAEQMSYLRGEGTRQAAFKDVLKVVSVPHSLQYKGKVRPRQDSMAEAVTQAQMDTRANV